MRLFSRLWTVAGVIAHFADRRRFFLVPMLVVLLLAGVLLVLTSGLSYVTPFFYAIF